MFLGFALPLNSTTAFLEAPHPSAQERPDQLYPPLPQVELAFFYFFIYVFIIIILLLLFWRNLHSDGHISFPSTGEGGSSSCPWGLTNQSIHAAYTCSWGGQKEDQRGTARTGQPERSPFRSSQAYAGWRDQDNLHFLGNFHVMILLQMGHADHISPHRPILQIRRLNTAMKITWPKSAATDWKGRISSTGQPNSQSPYLCTAFMVTLNVGHASAGTWTGYHLWNCKMVINPAFLNPCAWR